MLVVFPLHSKCDHWKVAISGWTSNTSVKGDDAASNTCGGCLCMACGFNNRGWEIINTKFEDSVNDEDKTAPDEDAKSKSVKGSGGHGCWK
jgi:hypothetical protein